MTRQRALLIVNPISGTASKDGVSELVNQRLNPLGFSVDTMVTAGPADATEFARKACSEGYHTVLACGGDGTVNEIAAALRGSSVALGILPCGSGNGLARHLGIPMDVEQALKVVETGHCVDADCGSVNSRPFFCTFGVGFDAEVSESFARQKRRGRLSYFRSALETYAKFHPQTYTISANSQVLTERAFLVAVCNASQYGNNAYIAPHASITDGLLDVTIVHTGPLPVMARMGVDMMTGYINRNTLIHTFRAPSVTIIRHDSGPAHLDGEPVTIADTMEIRCHPAELRVYTPGEQPFKPIITPMTSMLREIKLAVNHFFGI